MGSIPQRLQVSIAGAVLSFLRLQVFRAAADLKLRCLVTECLALLLPQFGRPTADGTGAQAAAGVLASMHSSWSNGP